MTEDEYLRSYAPPKQMFAPVSAEADVWVDAMLAAVTGYAQVPYVKPGTHETKLTTAKIVAGNAAQVADAALAAYRERARK